MRTEAIQGEALPRPSEPRWPVALTVAVTLAVLILLPARVRLLPASVIYPIGAAFLTPLVLCARRPTSAEWMRIEPVSTFTFVAVAGAGNLVVLSQLILEMIGRAPAIDGLRLLSSSIAVWATNVRLHPLRPGHRGEVPVLLSASLWPPMRPPR
ncbi:MAG: hypothetical protein KGO51_09605 [Alphaproteobacteria bacterium]|nr:hypothetical protein [Alphaproteobacteria bacterium]